MKAIINASLLNKIKPTNSYFDIRDSKLSGFIVRVSPNGKMVYRCEYARGKHITIGKTDHLTPAQARDKAMEILANAAKGIIPEKRNSQLDKLTLKNFIEGDYLAWREANRKHAQTDIGRIRHHFFKDFGGIELDKITAWQIEKWKSNRLKLGTKPTTINRDIAILKAALSKACEWDFIAINPLAKIKPVKTDNTGKVRFLSTQEENNLMVSLINRDKKLLKQRANHYQWKRDRNYPISIPFDDKGYPDHLSPMVILSIHTGLRRGELFDLDWKSINFDLALLTVEGVNAKSGKTRYIPLNVIALNTLKKWRKSSHKSTGLVFTNNEGKRFNTIKKAWKTLLSDAQIENFRWHDLRHHFASKLVMAGVDLNTVRELLGHADIKMTLRYAHLAPEHKANAVAKLTLG